MKGSFDMMTYVSGGTGTPPEKKTIPTKPADDSGADSEEAPGS